MASRLTKAAPRPRRAAPTELNGPATRRYEGAVADAPTSDEIRVAAYHKWVAAKCPPGDGVEFWLEAERELERKTREPVLPGGILQ